MEGTVRPSAVSGTFYPRSAASLRKQVQRLLEQARPPRLEVRPRLLVSPHAGYRYSGPTAATGYRALAEAKLNRVALLGPSHFVPFALLALPAHSSLATSLGEVAAEVRACEELISEGLAFRSEVAHRREHSLEVQLPFLQVMSGFPAVVPLLIGDHDPEPATRAIELLDDQGFFTVVSSDLSHYLDRSTAGAVDAATARAVVELRDDRLGPDAACGGIGIRAAIRLARRRGWVAQCLELSNSGDVTGEDDRVVGYGAFVMGPRSSESP